MRFNLEANIAGQAHFADALGVRMEGMYDIQAASNAADAIEELFRNLDLPVGLSQAGVPEDGIDLIAEDAMTDFALHRNVRKIENVDDLKGILSSVK